MITDRLQHVIDMAAKLPPEEQDRLAAAMQTVLDQPPVTSDDVRPEVMEAFEQVMNDSTAVLDYLRDK
ncbi:MAG TPA: hypothetical protein VFW76_05355 [Ktedonobacterales bacterium]|nr:hypothetical protein [Ktedonobacterales bacterium]